MLTDEDLFYDFFFETVKKNGTRVADLVLLAEEDTIDRFCNSGVEIQRRVSRNSQPVFVSPSRFSLALILKECFWFSLFAKVAFQMNKQTVELAFIKKFSLEHNQTFQENPEDNKYD